MSLVEMRIEGIDDLKESFSGVARAMQTRILKRAVEEAAQIVVTPLFYATPVAARTTSGMRFPPGQTQASTTYKIKSYRRSGAIVAVIGHRHPQGTPARWIEKGTRPRFTGAGAARGWIRPKPFFQPVWERMKGTALDAIRNRIADELDKYNARENKKFSKFLAEAL
jgi:hypothetical protein